MALLDTAEDLLGFHEGSAKPHPSGGEPVVCINREDFQSILDDVRLAQDTIPVLVEALQDVIAATSAYLPPDGIDARECLNRILMATDNIAIVAALDLARDKVGA